jgi:hypothetical protein
MYKGRSVNGLYWGSAHYGNVRLHSVSSFASVSASSSKDHRLVLYPHKHADTAFHG